MRKERKKKRKKKIKKKKDPRDVNKIEYNFIRAYNIKVRSKIIKCRQYRTIHDEKLFSHNITFKTLIQSYDNTSFTYLRND